MATPLPGDWDASLHDFVGTTIKNYIEKKYPTSTRILDVGAGWGKYKLLLPDYPMDAVEVWYPYITENNLNDLYDSIFVVDIRHWQPHQKYEVAIFGDSFEHLAASDARQVLDCLRPYIGEFILSVPYEMKQEEVAGNPFEAHQQDDLTPALMAKRYPELQRIATWSNRGVYVG